MTPAVPLAVGWAAAAALALADGRRRATGIAAAIALAAMLALLVELLLAPGSGESRPAVSGGWPAGVGIALRADALGTLFACVSVAVLLAALVFEVLRGVEARAFPALVLFLAVGLSGVFLTGDAFNFYVFFEVSMITSFALASYGTERREIRAASIFTIVNLLGSALFLAAVVALYHADGTLDLAELSTSPPERKPAALVMPAVLLLSAFALKLGLFPFHYWVPSVYAGTRPAVAAMLAGALANIGTYGMLRLGAQVLPDQLAAGRVLILILGSTTVLYGSLLAVSRRKAPEVLAYSAVSQGGYVLIAIGVGGPLGYAVAVLYAVVNALDKALLFLAGGSSRRAGTYFALGALSVAGVPPMAGFVAKLGLFRAVLEAGSVSLLAVLVAGSALSFVYMFQGYQHVFWASADDRPNAPGARRVVLVLALLLVAGGVWPQPLLALSERAAAVLVGEGR